jgi:hypothetical protein
MTPILAALSRIPLAWIVVIVCAASAFVLWLLLQDARDDARAWQARHAAQVIEYERAAAAATAQHQEQARVQERRAQEITDAISADYERRIADVRARAERLRDQLAANPRRPAGPDLPGISDAAGGADGAAGEAGLPAAYCPLPDGVIATEQAIRLDELQAWVREQANAPPHHRK